MPTEEEFDALRTEVARLTQMVEQLYYRSGIPTPPARPGTDGAPPHIVALVQQGNMIAAIKEWRALTGRGLAESKQDVDDLARRLGF